MLTVICDPSSGSDLGCSSKVHARRLRFQSCRTSSNPIESSEDRPLDLAYTSHVPSNLDAHSCRNEDRRVSGHIDS